MSALQDYELGSGKSNANKEETKKKIDWDAIFLKTKEGDNFMRLLSTKLKKAKVHWVTYHNSTKKVCVRCPVEGCPICIAGEKPKTNYILKVIDRRTQTLMLYEFSHQIKEELERLSINLKKDKETANDSITQYDIKVEKGPEGSNPLYHVQLEGKNKLITAKDKYIAENDDILISNEESLNIEELVKPWTPKRIREMIYGVDENGNPVESKYNKNGSTDKETKTDDASFNFGANVKTSSVPADAPKTVSEAKSTGLNTKDTDFLKTL